MTEPTRAQFIAALNHGWDTYIADYRALPVDEQQPWLAAQGYRRLGDLLAHIVAWWLDGQQVIADMVANPNDPLRDYDVNVFNAEAVAQYATVNEDAMIDAFEQARGRWIPLIDGLSDAMLQNPQIARRLWLELIGHLEEHALPR